MRNFTKIVLLVWRRLTNPPYSIDTQVEFLCDDLDSYIQPLYVKGIKQVIDGFLYFVEDANGNVIEVHENYVAKILPSSLTRQKDIENYMKQLEDKKPILFYEI